MALTERALTTLDNVKLFLGIDVDDNSKDELLDEMINIISDSVQSFIDREFKNQNYIENINGNGRRIINVRHYPITLINEIKINDVVIDSSEFEITTDDAERGQIYRELGWNMKTTVVGLNFDRGQQLRNIKINYVAGYILPYDPQRTLPHDIEGIVKTLVSNEFTQVQNGVGNLKKLTEGALTYEWVNGLTYMQLSALNSYSTKF